MSVAANAQNDTRGWGELPFFGGASIAAQMVQMACGVAVLRWVPPEQMGIWLTLQVVEAYALWIRLGVINAVNREYPFLLGQGRAEEALAHVRAAGSYLAACALAMAGGFGAAVWVWVERGPDWQWALAAYAVHAGGGLWRGFLEATFRGGREFSRLAWVQIAGAGLQLASLPLVALFGFKGFCGRAVLLVVATTALCHAVRPVRRVLGWSRPVLARLMVDGLPLFASGYLASISAQFPRVLLAATGGLALLGLYAPAAAVLVAGALLPGTLLTYLVPRRHHAYGRDGDAAAIAAEAWRQTWMLAAWLTPLVLIGAWVLPWMVQRWFPSYAAGAHVMGWAAAVAALGPIKIATSVFSTLKAWRPMLAHALLGLLLAWAGPWAWLRWDGADPLRAVMVGTFVASVVHAAAAWPCVRWAVALSRR